MQVIAPGKTPRGPSDRVKTDRKDAELLARLLLAGSLTRVVVPAPEVEAAREMTRAHDACRRDLMNARHRVSQDAAAPRPGLSEVDDVDGRAPPLAVGAAVRRAGQRAGVRRPARRRRRPDVAQGRDRASGSPSWRPTSAWWPTVARLRAFRGIDTLTALALHLELGGDWQRFASAPAALGLARADAVAATVRRVLPPGLDHQDRLDARPAAAGRIGLALQPPAAARRDAGQPPGRPARPHPAIANRAQQRLYRVNRRMRARGKPHNVIVVACARELACFLWAAATAD